MRKLENIAYGPYSANLLDIHLPDSERFPVFVYIHGGGFEAGDKAADKPFVEHLVSRGIAVVSINYRMYPDAKYPDFLEDAALAVAWVFENIDEYGECSGIFVGGTSAGGYASMMLCFDSRWLGTHDIDPLAINGWVHDAGQPTAHFRVLRERGIDPRRVIVDDSAPLYHIGEQDEYSPMVFLVTDNDMRNRYEQTVLVLSTLKHFGHGEDVASVQVLHGTHCEYVNRLDDDGESEFGKIIEKFIFKIRE